MLFNSYEFIFVFLPIALLGFFALSRRTSARSTLAWLTACSLFFYGWWNPKYLGLIALSMTLNYTLGRVLGSNARSASVRKRFLIVGVAANLGALGYFKYAQFLVENISGLFSSEVELQAIVLPLAISFFTFQQIAYLVDAYEGKTEDYRFRDYALFVTFFPQLIAGPIVHYSEMMPQFAAADQKRDRTLDFAVGLSVFAIGLFKKAVLADGVAPYGSRVFAAAAQGDSLDLFAAWGGALAYTMQLYFDFSGYSDMAIGAARLFGVTLPLNFFSPYKAVNISEFWRRWHMTLSRFLRDYLYIPLGGNRHGKPKQYRNLIITMLLGGLWHGAGWNFVIWGGLHGVYLMINHAFQAFRRRLGFYGGSALGRSLGWLLTFVSVIVGWVFFRATTFAGAITMLRGMFLFDGASLPSAIMRGLGGLGSLLASLGIGERSAGGHQFTMTVLWVGALMIVTLLFPNTYEWMQKFEITVNRYRANKDVSFPMEPSWFVLRWQPRVAWAGGVALLGGLGVLALTSISEFLYFQF